MGGGNYNFESPFYVSYHQKVIENDALPEIVWLSFPHEARNEDPDEECVEDHNHRDGQVGNVYKDKSLCPRVCGVFKVSVPQPEGT